MYNVQMNFYFVHGRPVVCANLAQSVTPPPPCLGVPNAAFIFLSLPSRAEF